MSNAPFTTPIKSFITIMRDNKSTVTLTIWKVLYVASRMRGCESPSYEEMVLKPIGGLMRKIQLSSVESFLRHGLKRKLRRDLQDLLIIKEADIECCAYYHLRRFLRRNTRWRVLARKHSVVTRHYTDLMIYKRQSCQLAIELKWRHDQIHEKDRRSLRRALAQLRARKCYFVSVLPDASNYRYLPKTKAEKYRLFEIVVDLGYRGATRGQKKSETCSAFERESRRCGEVEALYIVPLRSRHWRRVAATGFWTRGEQRRSCGHRR